MAVVRVMVPGTWMSTSAAALNKADGIVHTSVHVWPVSEADLEWSRGGRQRIIGEYRVKTLCGSVIFAVHRTRQRGVSCKVCAKGRTRIPTRAQTLLVTSADRWHVRLTPQDVKEARRATSNGADAVRESPEQSDQGTLIW